jgi:hypothetical protein
MPFLILQTPSSRSAGPLNGLTPIGRRLANAVVIPHPTVSRLHAWIEPQNGHYVLSDAGSRTGTFLNDHPLEEPEPLHDGDTIRIGPATLTFYDAPAPPAGIVPLDFGPHPGTDPGIFFSCKCGQLIWAASALATRKGACLSCNAPVTVPKKGSGAKVHGSALPLPGKQRALVRTESPVPPARSMPSSFTHPASPEPPAHEPATHEQTTHEHTHGPAVPAALLAPSALASAPAVATDTRQRHAERAALPLCSICQSPLHPTEARHSCPDCGLTFHADCWTENRGCSAYGCPQVNALVAETGEEEADEETIESAEGSTLSGLAPDVASEPIPWHLLLLAACGFSLLISMISFGVPSLLAAIATTVYILRTRSNHPAVAAFSLLLCAVGVLLGILVSAYFWYDVPFSRWIL